MLLAQALLPVAIVVAIAAAAVCRTAARDVAVPRPEPGQATLQLAVALLPAGLLATVAVGSFVGGYAGSLERAAWAAGSFAAAFIAVGAAGLCAAAFDGDAGRAALIGPLSGAAAALGAVAGLFGLASSIAGEGPWAAASLVAPAAGGAGLASLLGATVPAVPGRAAPGLAAGALATAAAVAGLLAGGYGAAVTDDAAWSALPLVVLAAALVAASVAAVPATVMAAARRPAAGLAAAWLAAVVVALAATGAAFVLLPGSRAPAAGAAASGAAAGLLLCHLGFLPGTTAASPAGRAVPWVLVALAVIAAWLIGGELTSAGFHATAGGFAGVTLALAAAIGPVVARASVQPFPPRAAADAGPALEAWAPPGAPVAAPEPAPAPPQPPPAPTATPALAGLGAFAAVALALAIAAHARHELLRLASHDPVGYAAIVQDLGLLPPGAPARYALANDVEARRQALEELRAAVGDDAALGPADARFLLGADADAADRFASERLATGALIPGEARAISGARWPLPALLPLPGASAGAALGALLAVALLAAVRLPTAGGPWRALVIAAAAPALLLACSPALRFWGPGAADALGFLAAFALVGGIGAILVHPEAERPGAAVSLGLALAGLALAVVSGAVA